MAESARKMSNAGSVVLAYFDSGDAELEQSIASLDTSELVEGLIELSFLISRIATKTMPEISPLDLIEAVAGTGQRFNVPSMLVAPPQEI